MGLYTQIIVKFSLGIICLILQINLMGKSNLAPTSPLDTIQNYVLGGIIGGIIYNESITVLQFLLVLVIWTLLVFIVKFCKEHIRIIKTLIDGHNIVLIQNGKVEVNECLRHGISANDLMFRLRSSGIFEIQSVKKAVLEQNGQLTIIEYGDENLRYPIIVDGQGNCDVLEIIDRELEWLDERVQELGFSNISEVYLGEYISGEIVLYGYNGEKKSG